MQTAPLNKNWYEHAVIYQIYPRSFQDTNNDGVGDLEGIIKRLDYLNDGKGGGLGVSVLWVSPFYPSPMDDFGYDVADYCNVDPLFGDLETFDRLLAQTHTRGMKMIIDFVPNHTSIQHAWFQQSSSSRDNPKRDWYIWRDQKPDGSLPNNWVSVFGGPAWTWHEPSGQYYLNSFLSSQPDLNWENPEVQEAIADSMRFWMDRGVDGFRIDAVDLMGKDFTLPDDPPNPNYSEGHEAAYHALKHVHSRDAGNYRQYLEKLALTIEAYDDKALFFEVWMQEQNPEAYIDFCRILNRKSCVPFNFELILESDSWRSDTIQRILDMYVFNLPDVGQPAYVLGNHDHSRLASRVGKQDERLAAMLLLTLPGVPIMYNGDEIGMENVNIPPELMKDPAEKRDPGSGRDGGRTPMQWTHEAFAGFSTTSPWLPLADNFETLNVAHQLNNDDSLLRMYSSLIRIRSTYPSLLYGNYIITEHPDSRIVSYIRETEEERLLMLLNMSDEHLSVGSDVAFQPIIFSTIPGRHDLQDHVLQPREGIIIDMTSLHEPNHEA
jgi:alpha-glucosidase